MTKPQGFAAMTENARFLASRLGGVTAHRKGTAHQWSPDEARSYATLGGKAVSQNREHMREIGRRGAKARWRSIAQEVSA